MASRAIDIEPTDVGAQRFDFTGLVVSGQGAATPSSRRAQLVLASVLLHATAIGGLAAVPLLREVPMPETADAMDAFFVTPILPPAPPPPPAPAAAASRAVAIQRPATDAPSVFSAPVDIPDMIEGTHDIDLGFEGGVAGGVEGGVAGGVLGGIVGGTLGAAPPTEPLRAGAEVREPRKLVDVRPVYPEVARLARVQGNVVIDCLIDTQGRVVDTQVIEGIPLLNDAALVAVRQWRYTPTLYAGIPVPIRMTVTVHFRVA